MIVNNIQNKFKIENMSGQKRQHSKKRANDKITKRSTQKSNEKDDGKISKRYKKRKGEGEQDDAKEKLEDNPCSDESDDNNNKMQDDKKNQLLVYIDRYIVYLLKNIGEGKFASVYEAQINNKKKQRIVCKVYHQQRVQKIAMYNTSSNEIIRKIQVQSKVYEKITDFTNIVRFYDFKKIQKGDDEGKKDNPNKQQKQGYYFFLERCDNNLQEYIRKKENNRLRQSEALNYFSQLLKGYHVLYDNAICHRDLKPQNLLLISDKILKIADFGQAKIVPIGENIETEARRNYLTQSFVGTIKYMAPQVLQESKSYNPFKSDVWSMGIILYRMLYGKQPYQSKQRIHLLTQIRQSTLNIPTTITVSKSTKQILKKMIEKNEQKRISFEELYDICIVKANQPISDNEKLIRIFCKIINFIGFDSTHYASLRQMGIEEYQSYSYGLICLIHSKCLKIIKYHNKQIKAETKEEVESFAKFFFTQIHEHSKIKVDSKQLEQKQQIEQVQQNSQILLQQLEIAIQNIVGYEANEMKMLHYQVRFYLLLLIMLYNYLHHRISVQYIYTLITKYENNELIEKNVGLILSDKNLVVDRSRGEKGRKAY